MPTRVLISSPDPFFCNAMIEQLTAFDYSPQPVEAVDAKDMRLVVIDADGVNPMPGALALGIGQENTGNWRWFLRTPFRLETLLSLLRSIEASITREESIPLPEGWMFDPREKTLKHAGGGSVTLTGKECLLLQTLSESRGALLTRQELLECVWGYGEAVATHTLETHIHRLRSKLKEAGIAEECIVTEPEGYRLNL